MEALDKKLMRGITDLIEQAAKEGLTEPEMLGVLVIIQNGILYEINKRLDGIINPIPFLPGKN